MKTKKLQFLMESGGSPMYSLWKTGGNQIFLIESTDLKTDMQCNKFATT